MKRSFAVSLAIALACLALPHPPALAQSKGADLSGVVHDSTGAVMARVTVTVRNLATNHTRQALSDDRGRYAFRELEVGRHELTAESAGFRPPRLLVDLSIGQNAEANLVLSPGTVAESVEVSATPPGLGVETRSSTYGMLVTQKQIETLPLNGRDFSQLILLQPGTAQARSDQGDILTGKGAKISVHGARTSQNAYMLDGTDILDALGRNAASAQGLVSGIESVQEFTVLTNTYSAEYGRAAGGVFNIVTRSGGNEFHGSAFEYFRNDALDAPNFFDAEKPPFNRNQFGFSASGPLAKDKAFFFLAYEGLREKLGITDVQPVPSLAARRGAFLPAGAAVDPRVVPYLALFPLPTVDNPTGEKATFIGRFDQRSDLDTYNARIDSAITPRDSLFVRYTHNDSDILFLNPETFPDFPNTGRNNQKFLTVGQTHIFAGGAVNNLRYAFNRTTPLEEPTPPNGFTELAFVPGQLVGDISISGYKRFGTDRNTPRSFFQNTNQVTDDLSFVRGAHALKVGGNVQHFDIKGNSASRNRGEFTINTFSDFLRGRSRDFVGLAPGQDDTIRHHRQWLFGVYVQDDWKARPKLTLNLGLRYEFITVPTEVEGKVTNVRTPTDPAVTVGDPLFKNPSYRNLAPRLGFAYTPDERTSIRGGFGIYYDELLYSVYGNMTFKHPPYFKQVRINGAPFPNVFPLLASGQGLVDTFAIDYDPKSTYVMQYNVNVQRTVSSKLLVTAAYVGSRGYNLWREADFNNAIPLDAEGTRFAPVATPQRRNPNFANIRFKVADARSFYNALQVGLVAQPSNRLRAQLSYTLGKSTDDQSSSLGRNEFGNGQARTVDPYNPLLNRGRSDFDVRHTFSANFSWDLPFGPGRAVGGNATGVGRALLEGWQIAGIFTALSGIPVSPIFTFDQDRDATTDNEQRPDWAPGVSGTTRVSRTQLFDPAVFVLPAVGSRGNVPRNAIDGPGLASLDMSLTKSFSFGAQRTRMVQLRIEGFNLLNRVNFAIPSVANLTVFNSPTERNTTGGQITSTATPGRQLQLALRVGF
jgi:outer membrane receptor protein involved in Fe transport